MTDAIIRSEAYNVEEYFTPQQGFDYIVQLVAHIYLGNGHQYYSGTPEFHVHYYGRSIGISEDEADTIVIKEFLKARKFTPNVSRYFHLRQDILRKLVLENRKYQEQLIASCPWGSGFKMPAINCFVTLKPGRNSPTTPGGSPNGYSRISPLVGIPTVSGS